MEFSDLESNIEDNLSNYSNYDINKREELKFQEDFNDDEAVTQDDPTLIRLTSIDRSYPEAENDAFAACDIEIIQHFLAIVRKILFLRKK